MVDARRARVLFIAGWFVVAAAVRIGLQPLEISHDNAINLEVGAQILEGRLPYRDFFDVGNPPSVMYAHVLPVLAARVLGVSVIPVFTTMVLLLAAWSAWSLQRLLARFWPSLTPLDLALCMLPPLVSANASNRLFTDVFGQREHLFMLLYLPFFVLRAARWRGADIPVLPAAGFGVAAAIGMSMKPYFALEALAVEGVWVCACRRLSPFRTPEIGAIVAVAGLCAGWFLAMPAIVRDGYFGHLVPMVLQGYRQFDASTRDLLLRLRFDVGVFAVLGSLGLIFIRWSPLRDLALPVGAMLGASMAAYLYQHKGWGYHLGAFRVTETMLGALAATGLLAWRRGGSTRRVFRACVAGLALVTIALLVPRPLGAADSRTRLRDIVQNHTRANDRVLVLDTGVWPAYPMLLQLNLRPASRFLWMFPVPMLRPWEPMDDDRRALERWFLDGLTTDLRENPPALVIIPDAQCNACPQNFSLISYFRERGVASGAAGTYVETGRADGYSVWGPASQSASR